MAEDTPACATAYQVGDVWCCLGCGASLYPKARETDYCANVYCLLRHPHSVGGPDVRRLVEQVKTLRARHARELAERDAEMGRLREALAACGRAGCPTAAALSSAPPQAKPVVEHDSRNLNCPRNCDAWMAPGPHPCHADHNRCDCGATREET